MPWEAFVSRFEDAFEQYKRRRLPGEEAGELRRLAVRYEEDGIEGPRDRRIGKVSPRRAPARELDRMPALYRERYSDFTVTRVFWIPPGCRRRLTRPDDRARFAASTLSAAPLFDGG
jgi:hypothetical protein